MQKIEQIHETKNKTYEPKEEICTVNLSFCVRETFLKTSVAALRVDAASKVHGRLFLRSWRVRSAENR